MNDFVLRPVGRVSSEISDLAAAPRQGDEGAPDVWIEFDPTVRTAIRGLKVGDDIIVLTWLDQADRDMLEVHPRGDVNRPLTGVFATRASHRPNPVGLHTVRILAIEGDRIRVSNMEAIDGTPIIDVKPVLPPVDQR